MNFESSVFLFVDLPAVSEIIWEEAVFVCFEGVVQCGSPKVLKYVAGDRCGQVGFVCGLPQFNFLLFLFCVV